MGGLMSRCKALECVEVIANNTSYETLIKMEGYLIRSADHLVNLKTLYLSSHCSVLVNTVSLLLGKCRSLERAEFHSVRFENSIADWTDWIEGDLTSIRVLSLKCGAQQNPKTGGTLLNLVSTLLPDRIFYGLQLNNRTGCAASENASTSGTHAGWLGLVLSYCIIPHGLHQPERASTSQCSAQR